MGQQKGYFKSVKALPGHKLDVEMETGTRVLFDFTSRLQAIRWGALNDEKLFSTAHTDGFSILFGPWPHLNGAHVVRSKEDGSCMLSIDAESFMDLLMVDRTKDGAPR
jgi:hypothetical protein